MKDIAVVKVQGKHLYFELTESEDLLVSTTKKPNDLPEGAEPTSAASRVIDTMSELQDSLRVVAAAVGKALAASAPSSWEMELSIGFKGKTSPIPVILTGEGEAALKIKIQWKRTLSDDHE